MIFLKRPLEMKSFVIAKTCVTSYWKVPFFSLNAPPFLWLSYAVEIWITVTFKNY